jgi:outer membrane receptor protein involved in Fe transport
MPVAFADGRNDEARGGSVFWWMMPSALRPDRARVVPLPTRDDLASASYVGEISERKEEGMRLTRTDLMALSVVAVSGATGLFVAARLFGVSETITVTTTIDRKAGPVVLHPRSELVPGSTVRITGPATAEVAPGATQADPLIYVDGVRVGEPPQDLSPDEIERVEVVKGAAAIELFGDEAVGGVIQIFTKGRVRRGTGR